jgi:hypothetical protein
MDENIHILISKHAKLLGKPNCGTTSDVWSMKSCRESFACMRGSFVLDGDMLSELTGDLAFKGKLVDLSPIIAFTKFEEKRHTGEALATWKRAALAYYQMDQAVGLATEDGASNNKKSNRIIGIEQAVCADHDIARAVLFGSGDAGSISQNPELKAFTSKAGKQSASFSRSVVANKDLEAAQLAADPELKPHQCKTTSTKNVTRWTGTPHDPNPSPSPNPNPNPNPNPGKVHHLNPSPSPSPDPDPDPNPNPKPIVWGCGCTSGSICLLRRIPPWLQPWWFLDHTAVGYHLCSYTPALAALIINHTSKPPP